MAADPTSRAEFAWWEPYRRALRHSRIMFVFAASIVTIYSVAPVAIVVTMMRQARVGPWHDAGPLRFSEVLIACGIGLLIVSALTLFASWVAWFRVPTRQLRRSDARRPTDEESRRIDRAAGPFAIARGITMPDFWVIDHRAPNAIVFGHGPRSVVCITTGALAFPDDELAALCGYQLTAVTSRAFGYCTAAISTILYCEWYLRVLWSTALFGFLSVMVGVPVRYAGGFALAVVAVVGLTRLTLLVADAMLPPLLDDVAQLIDLDVIRLTASPAPYARMLNRVIADRRRVGGRWNTAHLWFERDTVELIGPGGWLHTVLEPLSMVTAGEIPLSRHLEMDSEPGLRERAARATSQANHVIAAPRRRTAPRRRRHR